MMNRRAAVASMLLKKAGIQGDIGQVAMDLPPETLCQFDKVLGHGTPSRIPGQDEGIVVAYKSGDTVAKRPMKDIIADTGIMGLADGGYVPSPKEKPRSPVGQELYGLGDVEFRADLEPYLSEVVDPRSTFRSSGPLERLEDDYVALMGLRALEQKYGGDYGKFIDTDARRLDPSFTRDLNTRGDYNLKTDKIRVKTTPTQQQRLAAQKDNSEELYRAYFSRPEMLKTVGHELFHAGMKRINENASLPTEHRVLEPIDWERLRRTSEGRAVIPVGKTYSKSPMYLAEKPFRYDDIRDLQAKARALYEEMGPPRVKNYADGGEVEPRSTDRGIMDLSVDFRPFLTDAGATESFPEKAPDVSSEFLEVYELLQRQMDKPIRERDEALIEDLRSRFAELQSMLPPPAAFGTDDGLSIRPDLSARFRAGERNWFRPWGPEDTVKMEDRVMRGFGRAGVDIGLPGGDRLSGGASGMFRRTRRLLPDEYVALGDPSDVRFGTRGVDPAAYDVSYTTGPHTVSGRYEPRVEGAPRNMPGGRSVQTFGYSYQTPQETFSVEATPFGRNMADPQTGEPLGMDRRIYARYSTPF